MQAAKENETVNLGDLVYTKYAGQSDNQSIAMHIRVDRDITDLHWRVNPHIGNGDSPEYYRGTYFHLPDNIYYESELDNFVVKLRDYIADNGITFPLSDDNQIKIDQLLETFTSDHEYFFDEETDAYIDLNAPVKNN